MKSLRYFSLPSALLLAGCSLVPGPAGSLATMGTATLSLKPAVREGGYRSQAVVETYSASSINHLQIKLFKVASGETESEVIGPAGTPLMLDLPQASLSKQVAFTNLHYDTTYRVRAYAYADAATASLISRDSGSYADVVVERNDRPGLTSLPVQLSDRTFNGQATASAIVITPGALIHNGHEGMALPPMLQTVVSTFAGTVNASGAVDDTGTGAKFNTPYGVAVDGAGNVYVADSENAALRKITSGGVVSTLAGQLGVAGTADGTGTSASFSAFQGIAVDAAGNVYVADRGNHTIRQVTPEGVVTTLAGAAGTAGTADGNGTLARFNSPVGIAVDGSGHLYVSEEGHTIRKIVIATGEVTTLAGQAGSFGNSDGLGTNARFRGPAGLVADGSGHLYVADKSNHAIRKIVIATGEVTTLAGAGSFGYIDGTGTAAKFATPWGITYDGSGNLYVTDLDGCALRKIAVSTGVVTTWLGQGGASGNTDGTGTSVRFDYPAGIAVDSSGNFFIADMDGHTIRKVSQVLE